MPASTPPHDPMKEGMHPAGLWFFGLQMHVMPVVAIGGLLCFADGNYVLMAVLIILFIGNIWLNFWAYSKYPWMSEKPLDQRSTAVRTVTKLFNCLLFLATAALGLIIAIEISVNPMSILVATGVYVCFVVAMILIAASLDRTHPLKRITGHSGRKVAKLITLTMLFFESSLFSLAVSVISLRDRSDLTLGIVASVLCAALLAMGIQSATSLRPKLKEERGLNSGLIDRAYRK